MINSISHFSNSMTQPEGDLGQALWQGWHRASCFGRAMHSAQVRRIDSEKYLLHKLLMSLRSFFCSFSAAVPFRMPGEQPNSIQTNKVGVKKTERLYGLKTKNKEKQNHIIYFFKSSLCDFCNTKLIWVSDVYDLIQIQYICVIGLELI